MKTDETTGSKKYLIFTEWRDNSMGNNTLRFKYEFSGFSFNESRMISLEAIKLAAKLADELEINLKDF